MRGGNVSSSLLNGGGSILGNEVQQIAFILLTLIILVAAVLNPSKLYLTAYTSATLGLIVIISSFYNLFILNKNSYTIVELVIGFILIVSGLMMEFSTKKNLKEKDMIKKGIQDYKKTIKK